MHHFNPFYKDICAQREAVFSLKGRVTDPLVKGKIDDYLEMFAQFKAKIYTEDGMNFKYNGNLQTDKLYGKNGNSCNNIYGLKEFGDMLISRK